jgi:hypothetical protein
MKRSEMVKKLTEFGVSNDLFDLRDQYSNLIANQILTFLLNQGMLPPPTFMKGMPKIEGNDCELIWDDENDDN